MQTVSRTTRALWIACFVIGSAIRGMWTLVLPALGVAYLVGWV